MICKWCGATADVTKGICTSCGRELPPLSDCGGFYDIVPEAVRKTFAAETVSPEISTQESTTIPVSPVVPVPPVRGERRPPRSSGRGLIVVLLALLLAVVSAFTALLVSSNRRNDKLTEQIEALRDEIDDLEDDDRPWQPNSDKEPVDDKEPNDDKEPDGAESEPGADETAEPDNTTEESEENTQKTSNSDVPEETENNTEGDPSDGDPNFNEEDLSFIIDLSGVKPSFEDNGEKKYDGIFVWDYSSGKVTCTYKEEKLWDLTLTTETKLEEGAEMSVEYDVENALLGDSLDNGAEFAWEYKTERGGDWKALDGAEFQGKTSTYQVTSAFLESFEKHPKECYFRCTVTRRSVDGGTLTIEVIWKVLVLSSKN